MLIEKHTYDNGLSVALWDIAETEEQLMSLLGNDAVVAEELIPFTSTKRRLEYLASRCALNELVGSEQHVCYYPNGAPYLANNPLNISISHTGHYALVAIHPTDKVGIDIERIGDKVGRVRHKFLSHEELGAVDARSEKIHLTILWAAKEAMYKVMGVETVEFTEQIRIEPFTPYMDGEIIAHETASANKKEYKLQYKVYPEFVIVHTI